MKQNKLQYNRLRFLLFLSVLLLTVITAEGQTILVNDAADSESYFTPENLVRRVLVTGDCAVVDNVVTNLDITDPDSGQAPGDLENKSYGYFRRAPGSDFPFAEGIILTTGRAFRSGNSTITTTLSDDNGIPGGDADLSAATGDTSYFNAVSFEFDFVPNTNEISFRYLMASEEYTTDFSFPCDGIADSFAFLLRPEGTTNFENIALIPGTTDFVSVPNIYDHPCQGGNDGPNQEFYAGGIVPPPGGPGTLIVDTNYDGRTVVLTARANVVPGTRYRIKLVIADFFDTLYDSAVFLEAGSFNLGLDLGDDFVSTNNSAVCGDSVELTANITGLDYQWFFNDAPIAGATNQIYTASATDLGAGVYKCEISSTDGSCTGEDEVVIDFEEPATINPSISIFQECDPDGDLVETFDLTSKDTEILNGQDPANFEVQYFTDSGYTNQITDPANFNNSSEFQLIYTRVVNRASSNCSADGSFPIQVTGLPIPTQPADYEICDDPADGDDTNGFLQNFDLASKDAEILGTLSPTQFEVSYHTTESDAQTGLNPIDKTVPYSNTVANQQPIYFRVQNVDNGDCFQSADDDTSTSYAPFNLIVSPLPDITAVVELRQCDDDTDGFSSFNLNEAAVDISTNAENEIFEFFETQAEALSATNAITNPTTYTNQVQTSDTVWARVSTPFGCFRIAQVNLTVATNASGVTNFAPRTYNVCDDYLDIDGNDTTNNDDTDGITAFNFSDVTNALLNEFPAAERPNLIITYYRNDTDAFAESDAITDISNYRNIGYPNTQQIYVRVDNITNNDCIGLLPLITLNVDPVPVSNPVADLEACDNSDDGNPTNGFIQTFDIESQTPIILGAQNPADFTVSYHLTVADAAAGTNAIANTSAYTNTTANRQTIYVRVTNNTTGCYVDRSSFDLIVNPLPIANFVPDLEVCDDGTGGSAQNGIASGIELDVQTAGILGAQDPANFTVTYHRSFEDARDNIDPIPASYTNETPFVQTIHIRIVNLLTGCVNSISNFNLIINEEPTAEDIGDLPYCDDDLDGDDTNGFVQNIDLDSQIPGILGIDQDEDDFTVTFHELASDAADGLNPLSSPYSNTQVDSQTIYVRIVKDDTGCVNSSYSFNVVINPLPDFQLTSPQIVCLNDPTLVLAPENPAGIYDYVWNDPEGNETVGSQLDPTVGGVYSLTATATDGTGCTRTREVTVTESIIATLTDADISIVDDSENNSISIDPTNLGIGDYEYALADDNGNIIANYQDDPLFENLEGGFYTVLVRDKNGCGTASLDVPVVEFPRFFTPNNDGVNDTWAIKGANSIFFPESEVNIFNRFGKVVAQIRIDNPGWDGTFNGKTLPSDDYWFSIRLVDRNGNVRTRTGNMSLLRRE
jgi:gliding motility-associated-like protein